MSKNIKSNNNEDFEVVIASHPKHENDPIVLTSFEMADQWLNSAMKKFDNNYKQYSAYLKETSMGRTVISNDLIDNLADNPQGNLKSILDINKIVKYYINKDDLIGKVYEIIESNVNTTYKNIYSDFSNHRNKKKMLENAKQKINDFNEQINLPGLIRKVIPLVYSEGNYVLYLRENDGNYVVDSYPLGVVEVSDYEVNNEPWLLLNIKELTSRLQKVFKKNKKGRPLFFDDIESEIESNYPIEVLEAYRNKESYAKLDIKYSGILRINNLNGKYGLTPIFRALKSAIMLEVFENTDRINAKAKGKKIIFQKLSENLLDINGNKDLTNAIGAMSYAHESFMQAWKNDTVIYTGIAGVEDIKYIEPQTENINIDTVNYNRSKIMTSLGIGFLNQDSKQTFTVANLSVKELLKTINKIAEQLEWLIKKWYKIVLENNNIPLEFCPNLQIFDAEQLELDIKMDLVELLYSKLNCSLDTAYSLIGISIEDEKQKRIKEKDEDLDKIFTPRVTAYTNNGNNSGDSGRPKGDAKDPDSVPYHDDRNNAK